MGSLSLSVFDDVRIWVPWGHISGRWYGNRSERPILAIHGWLDNLGTFDTLIPLLPDYLGVLCIDLPGHGWSSRVAPGVRYGNSVYMHIIASVMKEYKWTKVSLMGHSLGGILSFFHTALAPHTVDLVISLDIIVPPKGYEGIEYTAHIIDRQLVEDERIEEASVYEPLSCTLSQLRSVLSKGNNDSVPPEFAHHLLCRSTAKSKLYPDKFNLTSDNRIKMYSVPPLYEELYAKMALSIRNKPYLIIKASNSSFISSHSNEVISILRNQNSHFEYHEVPGTHYVHLTHAKECAQYIVPFLRRHRPPTVSGWSLAGEEQKLSQREHRKEQENFFARNIKRFNKL